MSEHEAEGRNDKCLIIAEAGVNHNGDLGLALEMIACAADAGVDVIKFQTFKADDLASKETPKATYQIEQTGGDETQYELLKRLELNRNHHDKLVEACEKHEVEFLSTAFESSSLKFLAEEVRIPRFKVPSGDLTNGPFLLEHARYGRPTILSTGMSTLREVEMALGVMAFGLICDSSVDPGVKEFERAFLSTEGQQALREKVSLLHCTSNYPTPPEDVNLRAMDTLRDVFGLETGYSDHTEGIEISIAAVARGARVIEKHFTMDRSMEGPDHAASIEPDQLVALVSAVRATNASLGSPLKGPQKNEYSSRDVGRKSILARQPIQAGELFSVENLAIKRPGTGRNPMDFWDLVGKPATRDYEEEEAIE